MKLHNPEETDSSIAEVEEAGGLGGGGWGTAGPHWGKEVPGEDTLGKGKNEER